MWIWYFVFCFQAKIEFSENYNITGVDSGLSAIQRNMDVEQEIGNHATENIAEQTIAPTMAGEVTKKMEKVMEGSKLNEGQGKDGENVTTTGNKDVMLKQTEESKDGKMEVDGEQRSSTASPRAQKKKAKKKEPQQPVSEQAIPLPPPPPTESRAK